MMGTYHPASRNYARVSFASMIAISFGPASASISHIYRYWMWLQQHSPDDLRTSQVAEDELHGHKTQVSSSMYGGGSGL